MEIDKMAHKESQEDNPWLGLQTYSEGKKLYGRNKDISALTFIIENSVATILFGRSGIGKSSLIHAGLFPVFRNRKEIPIYIRFEHNTEVTYINQIIAAVTNSIHIKDRLPKSNPVDGLWDFFYRNDFLNEEKEFVRPILVIDQFEEIYTLADEAHKGQAKQLFDELADLFNNVKPDRIIKRDENSTSFQDLDLDINESTTLNFQIPTSQKPKYKTDPDFSFVISLREDYLYYLERNTSKIPSLKLNRYALRALNVNGAKDVICLPIADFYTEEQAKIIIDKLAVVDENEEKEIDPTILSVFLYKSFMNHGETKSEDVIGEFYRDETKSISEESLAYLEEHLITGQGFRQSIPYTDAIDAGVASKELAFLLKSRILTIASRRGYDYIEYSHDVLCPIAKQGRDDRFLRLQKKKFKKRIAITSIVLFFLLAFGLVVSYLAYKVSEKDREVATLGIYNKSIKASHQIQNGDVMGAIRILMDIVPKNSETISLLPETETALYEAYDSLNTQYASIAHLNHPNDVNSAMYSPDGKQIVTACSDGNCYLWSTASCKETGILIGHNEKINFADFSHNNKMIISASSDNTAIIWDAETKKPIFTLTGHLDEVLYAAFSLDDKYVATASADKTVRLWDTTTGSQIYTFANHTDKATSCHFTKDKNIISSSWDGSIRIVNMQGVLIKEIKDIPNMIDYASLSSDGKHILAVTGSDIKIWDFQSGELIAIQETTNNNFFTCANFNKENNIIVYSQSDGRIGLWNWRTNQNIEAFKGHIITAKYAMFSPDEKYILSSARDNKAIIWNLIKSQQELICGNDYIPYATFSKDADMIASSTSDNKIKIWKYLNGKYENISNISLTCYASSVTFSQDNKNVVATLSDGSICIYNIKDETILHRIEQLPASYNYAFFLPDNINVLAISNEAESILWNYSYNVTSTKSYGNKKILNDISISPDGQSYLVAAVSEKDIILHSDKPSTKIAKIKGHTAEVECVAFNRDGKYAVSGSNDNDIVVWDLSTYKSISKLKGHSSQVFFTQFTPDDKYIISISSDKTVRIWNIEKEQCIRMFNLKNIVDTQMESAISYDGKKILITQGANILIYDNPTNTELIKYFNEILL